MMEKVFWKVSGLVIATSTLVGLMGGLLSAPRSGVRTRGKLQKKLWGNQRSSDTSGA
jgi:gas vesicle protein